MRHLRFWHVLTIAGLDLLYHAFYDFGWIVLGFAFACYYFDETR